MSNHEEFGPFATAFADAGYLALLHIRDDDETQSFIDRIEHAMSVGNPRPWIDALFTDPNWRPHLVGAIALLLQPGKKDCTLLWGAIDAGSWVTPQLVATAYFRDPQFVGNATSRIDRYCPITIPQNLTPLERHSATGPAGINGRRGKMLASFLGLSSLVPEFAKRKPLLRSDEQSRSLLAKDAQWDGSDRITLGWLNSVRAVFEKRGVAL